jgi:hypothetical protein
MDFGDDEELSEDDMDHSIETQEQIDNDGLNNEDFRKTIDQIILENR